MRLEVFNRDGFSCQRCGDKSSTLHIHHLEYQRGKKPWEYDISFLVTICENCHEYESNIEDTIINKSNYLKSKASAELIDILLFDVTYDMTPLERYRFGVKLSDNFRAFLNSLGGNNE